MPLSWRSARLKLPAQWAQNFAWTRAQMVVTQLLMNCIYSCIFPCSAMLVFVKHTGLLWIGSAEQRAEFEWTLVVTFKSYRVDSSSKRGLVILFTGQNLVLAATILHTLGNLTLYDCCICSLSCATESDKPDRVWNFGDIAFGMTIAFGLEIVGSWLLHFSNRILVGGSF